MNTCATCHHWTATTRGERFDWPSRVVRLGTCEGKASEYADAHVSDDTGLEPFFEPAETFGCIGWEVKTEGAKP